jgi:hypothetical protein
MITAAMLVRDPPIDRLALLLEYLRPVVRNVVIVVDTRTAPEAVERMQGWDEPSRSVRLVRFQWIDDFSAGRNAALGLIPTGPRSWILHVDPDELPSAAMLEFLRAVDGEAQQEDVRWQGAVYPAPRGYLFFTRNFYDGIRGAEWEEHWHCRLFRRDAGWWYKPVHEQVMLDSLTESRTRGTPLLPKAPLSACLIHSKPGDLIARDTAVYAKIEAMT